MYLSKVQIDAIEKFVKTRVDFAVEEMKSRARVNAEDTEHFIRDLVKRRVDVAAEAWNYRLEKARLAGAMPEYVSTPVDGEVCLIHDPIENRIRKAEQILLAAGIEEPTVEVTDA